MKQTYYRAQVKMIIYRQVDVKTDGTHRAPELRKLAKEKARKEFGDCDKVEIEYEEFV